MTENTRVLADSYDHRRVGTRRVPEPLDWEALLSASMPEPRWAIPHLAVRGDVTMLVADPGTGKSTLLAEALVANEQQRAFLHLLPFPEGQRIALFDWENSLEQTVRTMRRLGLARPPGSFRVHHMGRSGVRLSDHIGREAVLDAGRDFGATCLVFDNRDHAFAGVDELVEGGITPAVAAHSSAVLGRRRGPRSPPTRCVHAPCGHPFHKRLWACG